MANENNQKSLRLSLKKKWFDMTKAGIKTEDYREINEYWIRRLTNCKTDLTEAKIELLKGGKEAAKKYPSLFEAPEHFIAQNFSENIMTFGYPKSTDTERILKFKHIGIRIRTGKEHWGAEPNKLYFVIMHGKQIIE